MKNYWNFSQGLEIKWNPSSNSEAEYFVLATRVPEERNALYENLLKQPELKIETIHQNQMTMQWQNGVLSNYDYLLYINR